MAHSFIVIDDELYEIELVIKDMMFALIALKTWQKNENNKTKNKTYTRCCKYELVAVFV